METPRYHSDPVSHGLMRLMDDISAGTRNEVFGLSQVVCGSSRLAGFSAERVEYCGIEVGDLVENCSFEAVVWLLLTGELPTTEQEADAAAVLRESAVVEQSAMDALAGLPLRTRPLELLPLAVSMLSYFDPTQVDQTQAATRSRVWRILAQLPVLLGFGLDGLSLSDGTAEEKERPSLAGSILQLVRGAKRSQNGVTDSLLPEEEAMTAVLICQCLTEMRPACFAARFFGSTVGDVAPSLRSAASLYVAQMKNDPYQWIASRLRSFDSPDQAEAWLHGRGDQLLPFGFNFEDTDPRAEILQQSVRQLLGCGQRIRIAACAERLEGLMARQDQYPTMDWEAAVVLTMLDVPPDRISLVIALSRMVGWAAQAMDQHASGVNLLPQLQYAL